MPSPLVVTSTIARAGGAILS